MDLHLKRLTLALAGAALVSLGGCGGSGGSGPSPAPSSTTSIASTVIDGAIQNALVCVDKNGNGACDAGETQGRTDAAGKVTLAVPNDDVGKYALVAVVGLDAVDADNGPVTEPFTLSAPPGKPAVVSPLTTQVVNVMASGATLTEAEASVKELTGITVSLFEDFTTPTAKAAAATAGGSNPADVARMIVVTTQAQSVALKPAEGTLADDGATINKADLNKAVQQKLLQLLPALVTALTENAGKTGTALEDAVKAALAPSLTTPAQATTAVAVNNQQVLEAKAPVPTYVPLSGISLDSLNFTDANNWNSRILGTTLAGATPDANGLIRVFDRRARSNAGAIANWNFGTNPQDQGILHWTGSAWAPCALNFEFTATLRDASGNNTSNYCNNYSTNASNRVGFDISGKTMASVYAQIRNAGYTNISITNSVANATALLGSTTFPAESKIFYLTNTRLTSALAFNPSTNSLINKFPQATGIPAACNGPNPATQVTTLEELVGNFPGLPCIYNAVESFTNVNGTFSSGNPRSHWGSTTLAISTIGTATLLATPNSYYTTNTLVRMAFTAGAANEVTYYLCKQREINGSTRECVAQPTKGAYTIVNLPDGSRALTLSNLPTQTATLTNYRVFIERNGVVYYGFKDKHTVTNSVRFNDEAADALLAKLGMPAADPEVAMALSSASYQGTSDYRPTGTPFSTAVGLRVVAPGNGTVSCFDNATGASVAPCTVAAFNPTTGNVTLNIGTLTLTGVADFMTGQFVGTSNDPLAPNYVGLRR